MVVAQLGDLVDMSTDGENVVQVTPKSVSDRGTNDPSALICETSDQLLLRCRVPRRMASYLSRFKARQLRENQRDRRVTVWEDQRTLKIER